MRSLDDGSDDLNDDAVEFEGDRDDEIVTVPCPYCRKPIWEEALACEHCGNYMTQEEHPRWHPWWFIAGAIACLACILLWILGR